MCNLSLILFRSKSFQRVWAPILRFGRRTERYVRFKSQLKLLYLDNETLFLINFGLNLCLYYSNRFFTFKLVQFESSNCRCRGCFDDTAMMQPLNNCTNYSQRTKQPLKRHSQRCCIAAFFYYCVSNLINRPLKVQGDDVCISLFWSGNALVIRIWNRIKSNFRINKIFWI